MGNIYGEWKDLTRFKRNTATLLFSGGLDSLYTAYQLKMNDIETHAILIDVGQEIPKNLFNLSELLNIKLVIIDAKDELCEEYIKLGIMSNALYNNHFPISSSYTRPLFSKIVSEYAKKANSSLIVHNSTPYQNSAMRFNLSIMAKYPQANIFCPAIGEYVTREEKKIIIEKELGIYVSEYSKYSVDENLWCRVIENDTLECTEIEIANDVFKWTSNKNNMEDYYLELTFKNGLPYKINNQVLSLKEIINTLNSSLSGYGIGRYAGLEDSSFGVKNPEIREAPAAMLIHQSHLLLEEMILTDEELRVKSLLDREWTNLVVQGGWFSPLKSCMEESIKCFNKYINGQIKWKISENNIFCVAKDSKNSMSFSKFDNFINEFSPYSINSFFQQRAREMRIGLEREED
ncbi:argininosuccinate synthase domain-containing protein [Bacillus cereus]|uniref:argininosuccinate synthase domain-containing protein n=1 Tax=Bacillus cereus TaxID=1396 RepID=UPI000279A9F3|nr:argininosuccinate synthase domain-containing protein [Bacillus cereus]EJR73571.1 argininosuccinate synthase [Bacillus cereus VD166]